MEYQEIISPEIQSIVNDINEKYDRPLDRRIFTFIVSLINLLREFPKTPEIEVIRYQLIKSATSIGANFEEAQAACSKADFKNKLFISLKEARECHYWMRLLSAITNTMNNSDLDMLTKESEKLKKILGSITSKVSKRLRENS